VNETSSFNLRKVERKDEGATRGKYWGDTSILRKKRTYSKKGKEKVGKKKNWKAGVDSHQLTYLRMAFMGGFLKKR